MAPDRRPRIVLALLALGLALLAVAYMTLGARGNWDFVLGFRGRKLLGLLVVAHAVAWATVLFQTVTANRILTPAIMGFDSLFVLVSTLLVAVLGSARVAALDPRLVFGANVVLMIAAALALYRWLLGSANAAGLHRLLLIGVVFGVFLRTLAEFIQRLLDPNEFMVLTDMLFASFTAIPPQLLAAATVTVAAVSAWVWPRCRRLDVMALGRPLGINLGLEWRRESLMLLAAVAVLVAVSVALVGPVLFFGLMVAALAQLVLGQTAHRYLLPAASLVAGLLLVGGQLVLERVFALDSALRILIEFGGGLVFIALLVARGRR
ncbi:MULTISPECIES: iron chelate uptake ABC transporter family permease subunit [unclassified Paracoccus (in: a-proteobacteria)]|uniref:iron chelate uptake ABC transporter family permease subunit n=1 Tax=unclassified Paracoccus (in: a-proteobacteria) TaxID=2688777 RepID=UPI0012B2E5F3|nr:MULTISPECIES: iron chelate uptake ABC transporter family permease subunit [unclassified Paracoccus (in: a-proteobacteria)]UXU76654.1 iron chelate uptake ABC transporter family permease subunit [Paracoccus sp. SMMA_5]UXU82543.1 iron chelate uptake ABC transporter family permease subunit [Paracoccus sp. SMMA_5_TC]